MVNPYREAVKQWGVHSQTFMVMEECGELLQAMSKFYRRKAKPQELAEEAADVLVMLEQIAFIVEDMTDGAVTPEHFTEWVMAEKEKKRMRLIQLLGLHENPPR